MHGGEVEQDLSDSISNEIYVDKSKATDSINICMHLPVRKTFLFKLIKKLFPNQLPQGSKEETKRKNNLVHDFNKCLKASIQKTHKSHRKT